MTSTTLRKTLERRARHRRETEERTNPVGASRSAAMVSLVVRRHAEPGSEEGTGRALSAAGIAAGRRLRDGTTALVITHGGNIVLPAALLARRLGTDVAPLPLSHLEGVRVDYSQGRWRGLERLSAESNSPIVQTEIPLGGNLSQAVRVGDTVRRRTGPWTPAVQSLLAHLHAVGFTAAPRSLGFDERGRAVLAYLPGDIHGGWPEPMPPWMFEDITTLKRAAELLRRYHDAVLTFRPPPDATWHQVAPGRHELICHNDWSPYNAIF